MHGFPRAVWEAPRQSWPFPPIAPDPSVLWKSHQRRGQRGQAVAAHWGTSLPSHFPWPQGPPLLSTSHLLHYLLLPPLPSAHLVIPTYHTGARCPLRDQAAHALAQLVAIMNLTYGGRLFPLQQPLSGWASLPNLYTHCPEPPFFLGANRLGDR